MKDTLLHRFLAQDEVQKIILTDFHAYSKSHKKGGSKKIDAKSENAFHSMFTRLLGMYIKETLDWTQWRNVITKKNSTRIATTKDGRKKKLNTYEIIVSQNILPEFALDFSNKANVDENNVPSKLQNFFKASRGKETAIWVVLATVSACYILDNKEKLIDCFIDLIDDINERNDYLAVKDSENNIEQVKILVRIMLQDFSNCNSVKENKSTKTTKKRTSKSKKSPLDASVSAVDLLYGETPFESAKYKVEQIIKTKEKVSLESLLREYHKTVTKKLSGNIKFSGQSARDSLYEQVTDYSYISDEIEAQKKYLENAADRIIEAANQQPLMQYLYGKRTEYWAEYYELLQIMVKYDPKNIIVASPIHALLTRLRNSIDTYTNDKFYTSYDLFDILGKLALSATHNYKNDYKIIFNEFSGYSKKILEELKIDIINSDFMWITHSSKDDTYRFSLKQYRLIFAAIAKADEYNRLLHISNHNSKEIVNQFLKETGLIVEGQYDSTAKTMNYDKDMTIDDSHTPDHVQLKFDSLIVYCTAFCLLSSTSIFYELIKRLCEIANDFSVKNDQRIRQEGAISILCNLLCEKNNMLPKMSEELFLKTYGESIYYYQISSWNVIRNISASFEETVVKSILSACQIDAEGYTLNDPLFIFLVGRLNDSSKAKLDSSLVSACKLQCEIWSPLYCHSEDNLNIYRESITRKLYEDILVKINAGSNTPVLCYSCNMLFYALADIERGTTKSGLSTYLIRAANSTPDWAKKLNEIIVFCDYYNRKLNRKYNETCCKGGSAENQFYMLCGPYRITAIKTITDLIKHNKVELDYRTEQQYETWYYSEKGRYKILLARFLLLCTDFFETGNHSLNLSETDISDGFLNYDCIAVNKLNEVIGNVTLSQSQKDEKVKRILSE